jgi:hypothetical protein
MGWLGQMLDQVGWLSHLVTWLTPDGLVWSDVRPGRLALPSCYLANPCWAGLVRWLGQMLDQVGWLCHLVTWLTPDGRAWSDGLVRC